MKLFDWHTTNLVRGPDRAVVLGLAGGRVAACPDAQWLYSLRVMLLVIKIEILWTTGEAD